MGITNHGSLNITMTQDLVSIIMLAHGRMQFVEESVRSVLAQTYTKWNYCAWMTRKAMKW